MAECCCVVSLDYPFIRQCENAIDAGNLDPFQKKIPTDIKSVNKPLTCYIMMIKYAIKRFNLEILMYLIDGKPWNHYSNLLLENLVLCRDIIYHAIEKGDRNTLRFIFSERARFDVDTILSKLELPALHIAASAGNVETCQYLVEELNHSPLEPHTTLYGTCLTAIQVAKSSTKNYLMDVDVSGQQLDTLDDSAGDEFLPKLQKPQ